MSEVPVIWMTNDPGGMVTVFPKYLYVHFSRSRNKTYRIDAQTLYNLLREQKCEFEHGGLIFIPVRCETGEVDIAILNEQTVSDKDQAVVCRGELREALYYWIG